MSRLETTIQVELPVTVTRSGVFVGHGDHLQGVSGVLDTEGWASVVEALRAALCHGEGLVDCFSSRVELEDVSFRLCVGGEVTPGDPGVWSFDNGDPGYPGTGPEVDLQFARIGEEDTFSFVNLVGGPAERFVDEKAIEALIEEYEKEL